MTDTTHLAHTIPVGQIVNAGDEVFPVLRQYLRGDIRLLELVDERDRWGQAKHGQPLKTGDERNTPTEIANELLDALAYLTKWRMQNENGHAWVKYAIDESIRDTANILRSVVALNSEMEVRG